MFLVYKSMERGRTGSKTVLTRYLFCIMIAIHKKSLLTGWDGKSRPLLLLVVARVQESSISTGSKRRKKKKKTNEFSKFPLIA
jgi:hypothetical protein